jgi:hypothetical protein
VLAALRWAGVMGWLSGCGYGRGGEQVVAVFQFSKDELGHGRASRNGRMSNWPRRVRYQVPPRRCAYTTILSR